MNVKLTIASIAALVSLSGIASAAPSYQSCLETAATNYAIAVAIDDPDADMVHENTMVDCWEDQAGHWMNRPIGDCYVESVGGDILNVVLECNDGVEVSWGK